MRGMRVGAEGAGVRRAAAGITGEGPVMIRGAWALAAKEKAKAAKEEKIRETQMQEKVFFLKRGQRKVCK